MCVCTYYVRISDFHARPIFLCGGKFSETARGVRVVGDRWSGGVHTGYVIQVCPKLFEIHSIIISANNTTAVGRGFGGSIFAVVIFSFRTFR